MKYSITLFIILFIATWIMHKPFNIHDTKKKWVNNLHLIFENLIIIQGMILINECFKLIK
ncbi:hypothetical protein Dip510_000350 [Elusimicrobium posterum]|uniref:hypothetical protein n=1 Tax=Elusimicrobium posterum TaxID=3116653 RepID=UPI003C7833E7